MALRKFAGEVSKKFGLRIQPFVASEATPFSLRIIAARAYATGLLTDCCFACTRRRGVYR